MELHRIVSRRNRLIIVAIITSETKVNVYGTTRRNIYKTVIFNVLVVPALESEKLVNHSEAVSSYIEIKLK